MGGKLCHLVRSEALILTDVFSGETEYGKGGFGAAERRHANLRQGILGVHFGSAELPDNARIGIAGHIQSQRERVVLGAVALLDDARREIRRAC